MKIFRLLLFAAALLTQAGSLPAGIDLERTDLMKGDVVRLKKPTVLLFNTSFYRQAAAGEIFQVAAYRGDTRRVYVNAKDNAGRLIALNAGVDFFERIEEPAKFFHDEIFARARANDFRMAAYLLQQAREFKIADPRLDPIAPAVFKAAKAAEELARADAARAEAKKRAGFLRHGSLLDTAADKEKKNQEATKIETETEQKWMAAKTAYDAAVHALAPLLATKEEAKAAAARAQTNAENEEDFGWFKGEKFWKIGAPAALVLLLAGYFLMQKIRS